MKIQVIFYSMYGHVYRMAQAVAAGAEMADGAEVQLLQVPAGAQAKQGHQRHGWWLL